MGYKDYSMDEAFMEAVKKYKKENGNRMDGFLKFPKYLFDKKYSKLNMCSKILYSLMLEREKISIINNWKDRTTRPYIYFTIKEASELFNISMPTATKFFGELMAVNLIEKRRLGQGKPDIIYVNKPFEYTESYIN